MQCSLKRVFFKNTAFVAFGQPPLEEFEGVKGFTTKNLESYETAIWLAWTLWGHNPVPVTTSSSDLWNSTFFQRTRHKQPTDCVYIVISI